ncbi:unnamed protein product [Alopecurus aequalis]
MAILLSCVASKALALYTPKVSRHQRNAVLSASAHRRQIFTSLSMKSWGINHTVPPTRGATQIPAAVPGPEKLLGGNFPVSNMPHWVALVVGAVFVAIPIYKRIRALEEKVEKTAEVAIEVVDTVAEAVEKVAGEVSEAFPENENLEQAASRIKAVADVIEEDAEKAEALIHKTSAQRHLSFNISEDAVLFKVNTSNSKQLEQVKRGKINLEIKKAPKGIKVKSVETPHVQEERGSFTPSPLRVAPPPQMEKGYKATTPPETTTPIATITISSTPSISPLLPIHSNHQKILRTRTRRTQREEGETRGLEDPKQSTHSPVSSPLFPLLRQSFSEL